MNIFVLSLNVIMCARYHCDKHLVKMILETTQLLFTAHHVLDGRCRRHKGSYRSTHQNHPCGIWTRACLGNYQWLCELGLALSREYTQRYNRQHKCHEMLLWLAAHHPRRIPLTLEMTPFAKAMPIYLRNMTDPVRAYREYYNYVKTAEISVTYKFPSQKPKWLIDRNKYVSDHF